jgi:hypothetical protein
VTKTGKKMSNPFTTGGGGHFEAHVQASFVALMLTGGFVPCLPCWPISKIKLQGKIDGYDTDDLIVFVKDTGSGQSCKMLVQIKHSITITENNPVFKDVIQAAWNDFNNDAVFTRNKDVIALITGQFGVKEVGDVRMLLEWARHWTSPEEFFRNVKVARFSSENKQKMLQAFRTQLNNANGGNPVTDAEFFEFLKHFHILGYDLDIKAGVNLSLLHSLIGQYSQDNVQNIWARLVDEVQSYNKNAGTITLDKLPADLRDVFRQKTYEIMPEAYLPAQPLPDAPDWNCHKYASDLAIAGFIGAWDEKNEEDLKIIQQFISEDLDTWTNRLREILQHPESPLTLMNGKWSVKDRKTLWIALGTRIFDNHLSTFQELSTAVLSEHDPKFDLPPGERIYAIMYEKVFTYSHDIRKGMAETLALLGSQPKVLKKCSHNLPENTAILVIRDVLNTSDWVQWGSLNSLLPTLAEAAPDEFLKAVESALQASPCPFDELFSQEGSGTSGENYLTGLLWALERLAWEEEYFVRACVILGSLASHDPGGSWTNRPANSLTTILLPWRPQTTATIDKRKVAVQTLEKETPSVAWSLALSLLPNQHQISTGSNKPKWRITIPDDKEPRVSHQEYWEQVSFYGERAVAMANNDIKKLSELIDHLTNLPEPSFEMALAHLSSKEVTSKSEEERLEIWESLVEFARKHREYSDADWALKSETVSKIEKVAEELAPKNPLNLYRRLFSDSFFDRYEEGSTWEEKQQKTEERRSQAIKEILSYGGIEAVIQFAKTVESPSYVGQSLGTVAEESIDKAIVPEYLINKSRALENFAAGYIWSRQKQSGWTWVDEIDQSSWSVDQIAAFLCNLPFTPEAWKRATSILETSEGKYWKIVRVSPYHTEGDNGYAIQKLIEYGRPHAAIHCLYRDLHEQYPLDKSLAVKALLSAVNSETSSHGGDYYHTTEIIKALQKDPTTDPEDLFNVEWAYLPLLDRIHGNSPKELEKRLASDSDFFCEIIRLIYRPKDKELPEKEPSEHNKAIATNAWRLLNIWQTPPGTQADGSFSQDLFKQWLKQTKETCSKSGHLEIALIHVGQVLFYCPPDPQGLWIDAMAAEALNDIEHEIMRKGFTTEVRNSRGVHWVDPTGAPEREIADQYRDRANDIENAGFHRFAASLRKLAEYYDRDAEQITQESKQEETE